MSLFLIAESYKNNEFRMRDKSDVYKNKGKSEVKPVKIIRKPRPRPGKDFEVVAGKFKSKKVDKSGKSVGKTKFKCPYCFAIFKDTNVFIPHLVKHRNSKVIQQTSENQTIPDLSKVTVNKIKHGIVRPCFVRLIRCDMPDGSLNKKLLTSNSKLKKLNGYSKIPLSKATKSLLKKDICPICGEIVATSLPNHMQTHQTKVPRKKAFQCNVCLKFFYNQKLLESHMDLHADIRPYKCTTCEERYRYPANLESHQERCNGY